MTDVVIDGKLSGIKDEFFADGEAGDVIVEKNVELTRIENHPNSDKLFNSQLEKLQQAILEGIAPTDAFKQLGLPNDPRIKKMLMAKILMDTVESGEFPVVLKKAVLEAESFRMFVDAAKRGDDFNARAWASNLMKDPKFGMNKQHVRIEVKEETLDAVLNEPDFVEILD